MPSRDYLRIGLVGAGYISEFHVRAIERISNARIVGVTDVTVSRAKHLAARFKIPGIYSNIDDMFSVGVDVVHILTPPSSHAQLAIAALENSCHVLVEKPLAM